MAQKKITDLQLASDVTDDLNLPADDTIQTYRVTALQIKDYVLPDGAITNAKLDATAVSGQTADTSPDQTADYLLSYDASAAALKKVLMKDTVRNPQNYAPNASMRFWQAIEATATTIANGISTYGPDQWYGKNALGTNGVLTISQQTATDLKSKYACQLKITTAPTAAQANGCELYCILGNAETLPLLDKICSAGINVKALGNVTQVGVQFFYKTSEAKMDTSIGSEGTGTVNTSTYVQVKSENRTLTGSTITASGVVGFRVRITAVSSGNTYDINNGFLVELPIINIGSLLSDWQPRFVSPALELTALERYYEKSYDQGTIPGTVTAVGRLRIGNFAANSSVNVWIKYRTVKNAIGTLHAYSPDTGTIDKVRQIGASAADLTMSWASNGTTESDGSVTMTNSNTGISHHYVVDSRI